MDIPVDQLNESARRYRTPDTIVTATPSTDATAMSSDRERRKAMLSRVSAEPLGFAFERVIGNNNSVYSNFVELLADAKKKVGRIVIKQSGRVRGYATGFMVSECLLLTNWHVFNTKDAVSDSEVQFGYELDTHGAARQPEVFGFNPEAFFYSTRELDYCLVAVTPIDVTGSKSLADIGYQCSIKSLEALTGIDFSGITRYDTFDAAGGHEKAAVSAQHLATHIATHNKQPL